MVLADGEPVHIRPIVPDDRDAITALHGRQSPETIYFRFFGPMAVLSPRLLERFVNVDYVNRLALVAELGDDIIAVGRYERLPSSADSGDEAEVAFLVDDAHQGRGLGTVLLEHLAVAAREAGITKFVADTLPTNRRMLGVFHAAGFGEQRTFADGVVRVVFPIEPTESSLAAAHERERVAAVRSIRRLLTPQSVALVGASRRPGAVGHVLFRRLLAAGFEGAVYPVNPKAAHVAGVKAYPSVVDIPDPVDLAVIAVPAGAVEAVVEQCAKKDVGGLVVVSAGFAERDQEGAAAERRLVTEARRNGMRLIGPNSMGVVNTEPSVRLNATVSPAPAAGPIGFVAQSGGLAMALLDELARRRLGVSTFISAGNKADVSGNDLLQYWDDDPATRLVLMYIETFGNPRTFARVARRVSRHKPIVAVRSARSAAGSRAGGYPQARQSDLAVDALFRQTGVIRTDTLEELFDVAQVLVSQPLPAGRRVAIVGSVGGPAVLAADACAEAGLEVARLGDATQADLAASLPGSATVHNPVTLPPDASPEAFRVAVGLVLADQAVDAVMVLHTSPFSAPVPDLAAAIGGAIADAAAPTKPVVACVVGWRGLLPLGTAPGPGATTAPIDAVDPVDQDDRDRPAPPAGEKAAPTLPCFAFPEAAARALGRVADYAEWQSRPEGHVPPIDDSDPAAARAVVEAWSAEHGDDGEPGTWLDVGSARALLGAYGIAVGGTAPATGRQLTGRKDPAPATGSGELRLGALLDPLFGPLVTLERRGPGGTTRSSRTLPLTDTDAAGLRAAVLGSDDEAGGWLDALLLRLGKLLEDVPEAAEIDVGPLVRGNGGVVAAAGRVRLSPWEPRPELALRRLR